MHIAYITGELGFGGAERQLLELVRGVRVRGWSPVLFSLAERTETVWARELASLGVPISYIPKRLAFGPSRLFQLVAALHRLKPALIHCYLTSPNLWGSLAGRIARVPVVITSYRLADPNEAIAVQFVNRVAGRLSDVLIPNTHKMASILRERDRVDSHKIRTIHNGIDLSRFSGLPTNQVARDRLGLNTPPGATVVGHVGRFFPQKDHETLVGAARLVLLKQPDTYFVAVGDGPLRPRIEAMTREWGISSRVSFVGEITCVPMFLRAVDLLVLSSRWEGLPNVVMEAMAAGTPVVATDVGGVRELVHDPAVGRLVPPGSSAVLAEAILEVVGAREVASRMAAAARHHIQQFAVEDMVGRTLSLYTEFLQRRGVV